MKEELRKELEDWLNTAPEWLEFIDIQVEPKYRLLQQVGHKVPAALYCGTEIEVQFLAFREIQ